MPGTGTSCRTPHTRVPGTSLCRCTRRDYWWFVTSPFPRLVQLRVTFVRVCFRTLEPKGPRRRRSEGLRVVSLVPHYVPLSPGAVSVHDRRVPIYRKRSTYPGVSFSWPQDFYGGTTHRTPVDLSGDVFVSHSEATSKKSKEVPLVPSVTVCLQCRSFYSGLLR